MVTGFEVGAYRALDVMAASLRAIDLTLTHVADAIEGGALTGSPRKGNTMWVYRMFEPGLWTVGFYTPNGDWEPESDHDTKDDAAARVHYLNGGS